MSDLESNFPRYRIVSLIDSGGMSSVYLAEGLLHKRVALKVLSPLLSNDRDFRARFKKEAEIVANLEHPHIIPVYEFGEDESGNRLFLAMRFVDGADLRRLIESEGRLPPVRVSAIVRQLAGALDKAHRQYLVHRDIKPANVLIEAIGTPDEHIWLSDFGIAKETRADEAFTSTGQFFGTADYAAPEQIEGRRVDARTDVYALAGLTYHCLSGEVPYRRGTDIAKLWAHVKDPVPSLVSVAPDISPAIGDVVAEAMSKNPDRRHQTCMEFGDALQMAVAGERPTVKSRTSPRHERSEPETVVLPPRRRRRRWPIAAVALVLLAGAGIAYSLSRPTPRTQPPITSTPTEQPTPEPPMQTLGPDLVQLDVRSQHALAASLGELLVQYYSAINAGDFQTAYDFETSGRKNAEWGLSVDRFERYYRNTNISDLIVLSVVAPEGEVSREATVHLTFKTLKSSGVSGDLECDLRNLNIRLKRVARWRIDGISEKEPARLCS